MELININNRALVVAVVVAVSSLILLSFSSEAASSKSAPLNDVQFRELLNQGISSAEAGVSACGKRLGQPDMSEAEGECVRDCKKEFSETAKAYKIGKDDYEKKKLYQSVSSAITNVNKCKQCYIKSGVHMSKYEVIRKNVETIEQSSLKIKGLLKKSNSGQERKNAQKDPTNYEV